MPTEVSIVRPTDLVPAGIVVDGYKNITDLEIIKGNSQSCNAYNMFGKVMREYSGRKFGWFVTKDDEYYDPREDSRYYWWWLSPLISLNGATNLTLLQEGNTDANVYTVILYDVNKQTVDYWSFVGESRTVDVIETARYMCVCQKWGFDPAISGIVKNTDTDEVLFEWRK